MVNFYQQLTSLAVRSGIDCLSSKTLVLDLYMELAASWLHIDRVDALYCRPEQLYSNDNVLECGLVPLELQGLTQIEEMLISSVSTCIMCQLFSLPTIEV